MWFALLKGASLNTLEFFSVFHGSITKFILYFVEFLEPTKDTSAEIEHFSNSRNVDGRPSTQDVLTAARNKLTTNVGSAFNTFRPVSAEHDITYEDELEFKYDRAFRALDNTRMKNRPTHGHGTGHYGSGHGSGHSVGSYSSRAPYPYSRF